MLTKAKLKLIGSFCREFNLTEFSYEDTDGNKIIIVLLPLVLEVAKKEPQNRQQMQILDPVVQKQLLEEKLKKRWKG